MVLHQLMSQAYRLLPVCLFVLCLPSVLFAAEKSASSLTQLVAKSQESGIADARGWRILLHYPKENGGESVIDDPAFFLATDGRQNPESELQATLTGLFAPAESGDKHTRCRYPAREAWLVSQLDIDTSILPQPVCNEKDDYLKRLQPRSASLMFPAGYMNSPASMFGHTFIRIGGEYESELLSYAVNYAARTDEENGFIYAWKGVAGYYRGYYSILPQYVKVREYSSLEHRDIWEYRLNLTPDEVRQMALHVWELRDIYSEYFFFDENCSYNLLFLLETARPTARLTDKTSPMVIPLDTIRLARSAGLLGNGGYRPSQWRKIRAITQLMNSDDIRLAEQVAESDNKAASTMVALPSERRIRVMDLGLELLQFAYLKDKIDQENYRRRILPLLTERSTFGRESGDPYFIPVPVEPEQGHATNRVSVGAGLLKNSPFINVGFRPAYHGLDDPAAGYVEGAQIQFLNTAIRYYIDGEKLLLQRLTLVDIASLSEYEQIFRRTSWKVSAGFEQIDKRNGEESLALRVNTGGGISMKSDLTGLTYLLCEADGNIGSGLREWHALGGGLSAGFIRQFGKNVQLHTKGSSTWYVLGEKRYRLEGKTVATFSVDRRNSLAVEAGISDTSGHIKKEALMTWNHYF